MVGPSSTSLKANRGLAQKPVGLHPLGMPGQREGRNLHGRPSRHRTWWSDAHGAAAM